jgi:DNA-binding Lrp family transcriptional regulator
MKNTNYKTKDLLIVSHLRRDARTTLTTMSRETRIPISTIFDKIRNYKTDGLIRKNTAIINFEKIGYHTKALVLFSTYKGDRPRLLEQLQRDYHVNTLFRINSGWDLAAEVVYPSFKDVEAFLDRIEAQVILKDKKVFYILEEVKKEEFLSNPARVEADFQPK